jgi:FkbM family methyltransferase
MIFNVHDQHIGRSLDLYGEWAESELELLGLFIKPGDVVVDVGANIGTHSVYFAQRVGATGQVYAFEPQRIVFQSLCANLALNGIYNVRAFHAAVSREPGAIAVPSIAYGEPGNQGGVALSAGAQPAPNGERVPVMTLDGLAFERCRLIKIDVEGMELDVLEGGRALIQTVRPIVYLENNHAVKSPALISWLLARDYHLFWHVSRFFNPRNFFANAVNVFGNVADLNMIGVGADLAPAFARFPRVAGAHDNWEALQKRLGQ